MPTTHEIWVIDQIDGDVAAVEIDGAPTVKVPLRWLPDGAREGDVLAVVRAEDEAGSVLTIAPDPKERDRRLARSREQVDTKSPNDPGGDIQL